MLPSVSLSPTSELAGKIGEILEEKDWHYCCALGVGYSLQVVLIRN
jgi:hypothetical protein